jgi:hypothetical protein
MEACMIQANNYTVEITVVNRLCGKLCISGKCFFGYILFLNITYLWMNAGYHPMKTKYLVFT